MNIFLEIDRLVPSSHKAPETCNFGEKTAKNLINKTSGFEQVAN